MNALERRLTQSLFDLPEEAIEGVADLLARLLAARSFSDGVEDELVAPSDFAVSGARLVEMWIRHRTASAAAREFAGWFALCIKEHGYEHTAAVLLETLAPDCSAALVPALATDCQTERTGATSTP